MDKETHQECSAQTCLICSQAETCSAYLWVRDMIKEADDLLPVYRGIAARCSVFSRSDPSPIYYKLGHGAPKRNHGDDARKLFTRALSGMPARDAARLLDSLRDSGADPAPARDCRRAPGDAALDRDKALRDYIAAKHSNRAPGEASPPLPQREPRDIAVDSALVDVLVELKRAERLYPDWPTDEVHAAAIVAEEAGELIQAALQLYYETGSTEAMRAEAIQTAAMALRFIINLEAKP